MSNVFLIRILIVLLALTAPVYAQWTGVFNPGGMLKPAVVASNFPVVVGTALTPGVGMTIINLPAGIVAGDTVIVLVRAGNVTITVPTGWTALINSAVGSGTAVRTIALYKIANGTEGTTLVIPDSGMRIQDAISYRINTAQGVPESAIASANSGSSVNPPSLSPTWGFYKTLWLAVGWTQAYNAVTGTPANYTNALQQAFRSSQRQFESATEDPGAYTSTSTSFGWRGATIAIQGN